MAVRFKPERRCRNCPEPTKEGIQAKAAPAPVTYEGEGRGLWTAALVGCATLFELLFRYVSLDVPGEPLPQMRRLHQRLGEIIAAREQREESEHQEEAPVKRTPADYGIEPTEPSVLVD